VARFSQLRDPDAAIFAVQSLKRAQNMTVAADLHAYAPLVAPASLTEDIRFAFRRDAMAHLDNEIARGATVMRVDFRATRQIDASGLGVLVLLEKRAREVGLPVQLVGTSPVIRDALRAARIEHLFQFVD
jgi:ABC-type transporter Mla MlaB component